MKRALSMIVSALCLAVATAFSQLQENIGPGGDENKTITTKAPSGQYCLIQTRANPPLKSCEASWACYQTKVHFESSSKPDQVLAPVGLAQKVGYQAAADYVISPDERWFLRDQHIFAGWNILVLYNVEADRHVRLVSDKLRDLGLSCVLGNLHRTNKEWASISTNDFDHVSAENASWNASSGVIHFKVFARVSMLNPKAKTLGSIDGEPVDYNVKTGKVSASTK